MLETFDITHFKTIKKKLFDFKNLNILMGLNGMGKSSLIQSMLVFRQSKALVGGRLDLNSSEGINLGKTRDVFYQYSKEEYLSFNLTFTSGTELDFQFDYHPEADYFSENSKLKSNFFVIPPRNFEEIISESLFNQNFQYLNANRIEPKHINPQNYSQVVGMRNLGNHGEYTAHYIEVYGQQPLIFENLLHPSSKKTDLVTGEIIDTNSLLGQINYWMGEISPNVHVSVTPISSEYLILEYQYSQPNLGFTRKFKPENVGFGVSYVLPVVVALLKAKPGEMLIIENPESHIHPRGQVELGKLISLVAMNDVQIFIETHSDHILNGIRVAIKQKDIAPNRVKAFYFEKEILATEQYAKITDINFDLNGELSEYPPKMLDEWSNQLLKLL